MLTKVCAQALMRHRDMNVQFADDSLLVFPSANVGSAGGVTTSPLTVTRMSPGRTPAL